MCMSQYANNYISSAVEHINLFYIWNEDKTEVKKLKDKYKYVMIKRSNYDNVRSFKSQTE